MPAVLAWLLVGALVLGVDPRRPFIDLSDDEVISLTSRAWEM